MSAGRPKLDDKMEAAIAALLVERTHTQAASRAGISEATIIRWLRDDAFKAAYKAARRSLVESALGRLQQGAAKAVDALERNLTCGTPAVEVTAARVMLEQAIKAVELGDLAERVDELEALLRGTPDGEEPPAPETDEVAGGGEGAPREGGDGPGGGEGGAGAL